MLRGIVHINLPEASLHWSGGLILEEFSNGGRILVNLGGNQTTLNSTWSNNNTTYRLTSQAGQYYSEPFFLLDLNSSFINRFNVFNLTFSHDQKYSIHVGVVTLVNRTMPFVLMIHGSEVNRITNLMIL